jgi:hypothetical protein
MMRGEIFCPDTLESNQFYVIFPVWVNWNIRNVLPPLVLRECECRVATRGVSVNRSAPTQIIDKKIRDKKIAGPRMPPPTDKWRIYRVPARDHLGIGYFLVVNLLVIFPRRDAFLHSIAC